MDQQNLNEVTEKVKEYAELSKTIKITQEKLKILNKKKKELYKEVVPRLKTTNITKCNLPFGTLKVVKTKRKIMPTKLTMKDKYISFFNTSFDDYFINASAEEKAEMFYKYIYVDNIEFKEESNITMTYSKDFKDQFKELKI
jgi:nucleoside-specific outer membrane channel protein Tsx